MYIVVPIGISFGQMFYYNGLNIFGYDATQAVLRSHLLAL